MGDGVKTTFHAMRDLGIRHMPVLDEYGELAGMVSERDLRRPRTVEDSEHKSGWYALDDDVKIYQVMTLTPETVSEETPLAEVLDLLIQGRFGALPVVNESREVVGIVSVIDVLQAFRDSL